MKLALIVLSVLGSAALAAVWATYIDNVQRRQPGRAALSDFVILFSSSVVTQAWYASGSSFWVLALYDVAGAIGTYFTVRRLKRRSLSAQSGGQYRDERMW